MTQYLNKSFSVFMSGDKQYQDNYDKIFRKKPKEKVKNWLDNLLYVLFIKESND